MPRELVAFFESYRNAFNALNGEALAELYAEPSGIAQGGEFTYWPTRAAVKRNMEALCQLYWEKGYVRAEFTPVAYLAQGQLHAIVDLQWNIEWSETQTPWKFSTTYNMLRSPAGWKVLLCTAYEEDKLFQVEGAA